MFAEHTLVQLGGYNTNIIQFESRVQVFSEIHSPSADVLLLKFSFLIHRRKVQGWHKCFIKKYRKERYRSDMSASIAVLVLHITLDRFTQRECTSGPSVFLYFCICVFVQMCLYMSSSMDPQRGKSLGAICRLLAPLASFSADASRFAIKNLLIYV